MNEQQDGKNERDGIFGEIATERAYQDRKWGTYFDDNNTINDWSAYITRYLGLATFAKAATTQETQAEQRKQLIKVAALAVAALETFDRNSGFAARHYD